MQRTAPAISDSEVHLTYASCDIDDDELLERYRSLLTLPERTRYDGFRFESDRRRFLVGRALVRWTLALYARVAAEELVFNVNAFGKPEIAKPDRTSLRFNAANTRGLVACIVALDREVGVDVEDTTRSVETSKIADRYFSRAEAEALHRLPAKARRDRFFDYWTLKEAYVKGRGMGLSLPFGTFTVDVSRRQIPTVVVEPEVDDGERWQLWITSPIKTHRLAAAICLGDHPPSKVIARRVVPFAERG